MKCFEMFRHSNISEVSKIEAPRGKINLIVKKKCKKWRRYDKKIYVKCFERLQALRDK